MSGDVRHYAYVSHAGREYVLVSRATAEMLAASDDALEAAAKLAEEWASADCRGLAGAIRSLKNT